MEEAELIAKTKVGDKAAAAALISLLAVNLEAYSVKVAGDLSDREREVAVERAVKQVVRRIERYDPLRAKLTTWARPFVLNEINEARRRTREIPTEADELDQPIFDPDPFAAAEAPPSPETIAIAALTLTLTPAEQTLIHLRIVERLDFEAIAMCFDPPLRADAMRKRWERLIAKLARLSRQEPDLQRYIDETKEEK